MRTYDIKDAGGHLVAFEVECGVWVDRARLAAMLSRIPGVVVTSLHWSWWGPDEFCTFRLGGARLVAWEPFGDNSRYWIGPQLLQCLPETRIVRDALSRVRNLPSAHEALSLVLLFGGAALSMAGHARGVGPLFLCALLSGAVGGVLRLHRAARLVESEGAGEQRVAADEGQGGGAV